MLLCEFVLNSTRAPPREQALYHTLLQLYLAERLADEPDSDAAAAAQPARRCDSRTHRLCRCQQVGQLGSYE